MEPTLLVGDYLFVSKYSYGYSRHSMPFSPDLFSGRIFGSLPARGDVAVFKLPSDTSQDYIKRIVGLPGDRIAVRAGILHVNGQPVRREAAGNYVSERNGARRTFLRYRETLPNGTPGGRTHDIAEVSDEMSLDNAPCLDRPRFDQPCQRIGEFRVPDRHVFAMGDNRDDSLDSRADVGFIPVENLVGRAEFIFFSIDGSAAWWQFWNWPFAVRWGRLLSAVR